MVESLFLGAKANFKLVHEAVIFLLLHPSPLGFSLQCLVDSLRCNGCLLAFLTNIPKQRVTDILAANQAMPSIDREGSRERDGDRMLALPFPLADGRGHVPM